MVKWKSLGGEGSYMDEQTQDLVSVTERNAHLKVLYQTSRLDIQFQGAYQDPKTNQWRMEVFTPKEVDIFFALIGLLQEAGANAIRVPTKFLQEYSNDRSKQAFSQFELNTKMRTMEKIHSMKVYGRSENSLVQINLFSTLEVNTTTGETFVKLNPDAEPFVHSVMGDITEFEIQEMSQLRKLYAKLLFIKLKSHKEDGVYLDERKAFEKYMVYTDKPIKTADFKRNVVGRAVEELGDNGAGIFENLQVEYIPDPADKRRWQFIKFTFVPQHKKAEIATEGQLSLDLAVE